MKSPGTGFSEPRPAGRGVAVDTAAIAVVYSLMLAACGGFAFYASVWPVPMPSGDVFDFPWIAVLVVLAVTWLAVPVALLVLGLVHLRQGTRLRWRPAAAWAGAVTAGLGAGWVNLHDYGQWLGYARLIVTLTVPPYPRPGPAGPHWGPLIAAVAQLAAGAAMIALLIASVRKAPVPGTDGGNAGIRT